METNLVKGMRIFLIYVGDIIIIGNVGNVLINCLNFRFEKFSTKFIYG